MDDLTPAIAILGIILGPPAVLIALHWWLHPERRLSWRRPREASADADRGQADGSGGWASLDGGGGGGDGGGHGGS
jgi:hypothetical protein